MLSNTNLSYVYLGVFVAYSLLVFAVAWITSRRATNAAFFIGNRQSPWFVVAYGMIGASLSGVTFMSVPGAVAKDNFFYMPMVFGFFVGYAVIATVLMPLYYRMNLTSIYSYLENRFGNATYKTGAAFFILSRTLGATLRMFLVVSVLHVFILQRFGLPFWVAGLVFIVLIILYTLEGGIKTIVWTDTLQTTFMILAVVVSIVIICREMNVSLVKMFAIVQQSDYFQFLNTDRLSSKYFLKQFLSGIVVAIAMTGLDQEMMQKNLSCKNIRDAQKNMFVFSSIIIVVNFLFLVLGAILIIYLKDQNLLTDELLKDTDKIFPTVAFDHLGVFAGLVFFVGLISSAYPSADGAMTSLTTSVCLDIIGTDKNQNWDENKKKRIRYAVHLSFALLFFALIIFFNAVKNDAIINLVYAVASYTYGPLLGLFFFGILTKYRVRDGWVPLVAILSPIICFLCDYFGGLYFNFKFGFTLLIVNGLTTFIGCFLLRKKNSVVGDKN